MTNSFRRGTLSTWFQDSEFYRISGCLAGTSLVLVTHVVMSPIKIKVLQALEIMERFPANLSSYFSSHP